MALGPWVGRPERWLVEPEELWDPDGSPLLDEPPDALGRVELDETFTSEERAELEEPLCPVVAREPDRPRGLGATPATAELTEPELWDEAPGLEEPTGPDERPRGVLPEPGEAPEPAAVVVMDKPPGPAPVGAVLAWAERSRRVCSIKSQRRYG